MARFASVAFAAFVVLIVFAAYYNATSDALPLGAGPDHRAHNDVARFIYEHGRLAVIPQDESELNFTAYGGTRAFRPPLSYITSAAIARAVQPPPDRLEHVFRKGPVLFGALTVAVAFVALYGFSGALWTALAGTVLLGLLPQLVFVASYNNDDAAAILSGTLLLAAMLYVYRRGATAAGACALGLAAGVVMLTKQTAWLLLPGAAVFALIFVRGAWRQRALFYLVAGAAALAVCGWWLGYNVHHYGLGDPFLWNVTHEVAARHSQFPPGTQFGYAARGVGLADLWLHNHDGFWTRTLESTIGSLDLLRLRLGSWMYVLYGTVFAVALLYGAARVLGIRRGRDAADNRLRAFEGLLLAMLVFQLVAYTLTNLHNDVQLQGKYLLPAVLGAWVLFVSALARGATAARERWFAHGAVCIGPRGAGRWALAAGLGIVLATHIHAWTGYVVPFYAPPVHDFRAGEFFAVQVPRESILSRHDIERLEIDGAVIRVHSSGPDAHFVIDLRRPEWCAPVQGNRMMRVTFGPGAEGLFQVFFDDGAGFSERRSVHARYGPDRRVVEFVYGLKACHRLRIDPIGHPGEVEIRSIELAALVVDELQPVRTTSASSPGEGGTQ
jgi:hypothetical protein